METKFFCGLLELQYGKKVKTKLKKISEKIPWAKGWPENKVSFWNAEAFMWENKIAKDIREQIKKKLSFLVDDGLKSSQGQNYGNLDIGCGSYSYLPSVGFDISEKMLLFNDNCKRKVVGDLERPLPFDDCRFYSVTAVFVLNYVENILGLLSEIRRILKKGGCFVAVLYSKNINKWQRQKEINDIKKEEWEDILKKAGFFVELKEEKGLWFFKCKKDG